MSNNIVLFSGITKLDLPPDRVLDGAKDKLESVFVIGWDKDGEIYIASSKADGGDLLWLLKKAEKYLLEIGEE